MWISRSHLLQVLPFSPSLICLWFADDDHHHLPTDSLPLCYRRTQHPCSTAVLSDYITPSDWRDERVLCYSTLRLPTSSHLLLIFASWCVLRLYLNKNENHQPDLNWIFDEHDDRGGPPFRDRLQPCDLDILDQTIFPNSCLSFDLIWSLFEQV